MLQTVCEVGENAKDGIKEATVDVTGSVDSLKNMGQEMLSQVRTKMSGLNNAVGAEEMVMLDIKSGGRVSHHLGKLTSRIRGEAGSVHAIDIRGATPAVKDVLHSVGQMHGLLDELDRVQVLL